MPAEPDWEVGASSGSLRGEEGLAGATFGAKSARGTEEGKMAVCEATTVREKGDSIQYRYKDHSGNPSSRRPAGAGSKGAEEVVATPGGSGTPVGSGTGRDIGITVLTASIIHPTGVTECGIQ